MSGTTGDPRCAAATARRADPCRRGPEGWSVHVVRLDPDLPLPGYAQAATPEPTWWPGSTVLLEPNGGRAMVPTGIALALPEGYAGFVQPRSGLALRHGVTCLNTPGLIDSGYRDELAVLLVNTDPEVPYRVQRGTGSPSWWSSGWRRPSSSRSSALSDTERGLGGFGSTGR